MGCPPCPSILPSVPWRSSVVFAREEPRLFRLIDEAQESSPEARRATKEELELGPEAALPSNSDLASLLEQFSDPAKRRDFIFRTWVFTHGLAEKLVSGLMEMDDREIAQHLSAAGAAFNAFDQQMAAGAQ